MSIIELFPNKKIINDLGLVKENYIEEYIDYLSKSNRPFALAIMEIDNLVNIRETFGAKVCEELVLAFYTSLKDELKDRAVIGEYGRDNIQIILPNADSYDVVYRIMSEVFSSHAAVRREYNVLNANYYITATSGAAVFPVDSRDIDDLYTCVKKALYRGQSKGRNCFIAYVHSKHNDISLDTNKGISFNALLDDITLSFRLCSPMNTFLENVLRMIKEALDITGAFFIDNESNTITSKSIGNSQVTSFNIRNYESIIRNQDLFNGNIDLIDEEVLSKKFSENKMNSFIIKKVKFGQKNFGFVGFYSEDKNRKWKENEISLLVYVEKLIGMSRTLENPSTMTETRKSLYVNKLGEVVDVYTLNSPLFEGLAQTTDRRYLFSKNLLSNIVRWDKNAVEYFDLPDEYFVDSSGIWSNKIHPDDVDEYIKSRNAVVNGESEYQNVDYRVLNKSGEYIVCTSKAVKIRNNEGYELLVGTVENHGIANRIDSITNLYSIAEFIESYKNYKSKGINPSVLYVGINHFT